ncbi:MAG: hypothetical protein J6I85_02965 [Clostridia bacterium]|nr:hypothetical protein [Clostridia bacterium]
MEKINKKVIIFVIVVLMILLVLFIMNDVKVDVRLFDLTENEPLKQVYARNQEHFIEDIMPQSGMSEEQYNDFLSNLDNYVVYSFRCKINNKSDKILKLKYDDLKQENIWIDTVTMADTNEEVKPSSEINKNVSVLIKVDGKTKEEIESMLEKIDLTIHFYDVNNKELKMLNAKF